MKLRPVRKTKRSEKMKNKTKNYYLRSIGIREDCTKNIEPFFCEMNINKSLSS